MIKLLNRLIRWKLAIAFSLLCITVSAQVGYVPYALSGEACGYMERQVTEWTEPGAPVILPDTIATMLGVQPGDALHMDVDDILQVAVFVRSSTQPGCTTIVKRTVYHTHTYIP